MSSTTPPSFAQRFARLADERSPFCLGVDPSRDLLNRWGLPDTAQGLSDFCERIAEAAGDSVAVVKPQSAFFERHGPAGLQVLQKLMKRFQAAGSLALLDVKRGDIGSTMDAYAESVFGPDSAYQADAATFTAYLGLGALVKTIERARASGACAFLVVRSSNPEGTSLQKSKGEDGRTVAEALADGLRELNEKAGPGVLPAGAVMGATLPDSDRSVIERLGGALLLTPGIGAQGAGFDDLKRLFAGREAQVIPTATRSVLEAGPEVGALRAAILRHVEPARRFRRGA
ncbi:MULTISPECIES: orotidine-5'-phosphate decarboxylase [unclassified Myxococcus]|uniref:orotidine-5'-phosphate decarboxylase n=1 Tax=unclassified Myxococcus TaxID=2648731 RepID=UPI001CBD2848|nr:MULTISPECIES: orotidine-5'-phosphate decarboxylase [unclassified Myxococcus]MBZ4394450.1 orotidine-5'-phosphate decarboxylase [Myxococcus sp. AS-1-15]MBZ4410544.1 orotidine-5'-phosphate decarboxylase [Myxococcus sp. XM-1-1-1]